MHFSREEVLEEENLFLITISVISDKSFHFKDFIISIKMSSYDEIETSTTATPQTSSFLNGDYYQANFGNVKFKFCLFLYLIFNFLCFFF